MTRANIAKRLRGEQNPTLKSMAEIATALDAEWVGLELVSREEARLGELTKGRAREVEWKATPAQ